jgi:class 3 adenylate cyclase
MEERREPRARQIGGVCRELIEAVEHHAEMIERVVLPVRL